MFLADQWSYILKTCGIGVLVQATIISALKQTVIIEFAHTCSQTLVTWAIHIKLRATISDQSRCRSSSLDQCYLIENHVNSYLNVT